ncbi:MAG: hypothetical protein ABSG22_08970 [Sedimentisphaerales bacterium]
MFKTKSNLLNCLGHQDLNRGTSVPKCPPTAGKLALLCYYCRHCPFDGSTCSPQAALRLLRTSQRVRIIPNNTYMSRKI